MDDLAEQEQLSELHAKQLMEKLRVIEEDDEFDLAFRAVLQDSVSSVTTAASKNNLDKMVIPAILPKPKNTFRLQNDEDDRMMTTERQQGKGTSLSRSSIARMYVLIDTMATNDVVIHSIIMFLSFLSYIIIVILLGVDAFQAIKKWHSSCCLETSKVVSRPDRCSYHPATRWLSS